MANGQPGINGGFGPNRFVQAPIIEGQPVGTIPGEAAPRLGESALSRVRPPEKPPVPSEFEELENMDPRQVAEQAKQIAAKIEFDIQQQVELQRKGAPINLKPFLNAVLPEYGKAIKVWGDALERAGLSRLPAERRKALVQSRLPQIDLSVIKTDPGQKVDFFRGEQRVGGVENPPLSVAVSAGGGLGDPRTGQIQGRLPGKSTAGEKALETITTLSNALTETEKALETKPKDRALLNRRAGLRDKLTDKESVGGLVAPILSKVLAGTPIAQLPAREKEVLGFYQRQGLVDQLIGQILEGELSGLAPSPARTGPSVPVAGVQAGPFDLSKLGGKTKQTLEQAADAIENQNRDTAAVKQIFVSEFNGDPEAFDAFMKARGIKGF